MTRQQTVLATLFCFSLTASAQTQKQWIDLTETLLSNPGFVNNNADGWTVSQQGNTPNIRVHNMEFWNATSFDIHQTLTGLANGTYRIGVQGYYRPGGMSLQDKQEYDSGNAPRYAYLYGNGTQSPLVSIYSYSQDSYSSSGWSSLNSGWWGGNSGPYYPNTMEAAREAFDNGAYKNQLEVDVTDGTLVLGLKKEQYRSQDWCIFDNFSIEFYGEVIPVRSIELSRKEATAEMGSSVQLTASVLPMNATIKKLNWTSSNPKVATVDTDGRVTAVGQGSCTITATSAGDESVSASCTLTVTRSLATADQLIVNEIQACNTDMFLDATTNFDGWIELYNPTDRDANIGGYYMSDDADNLTKWRMPDKMGIVPAHGFRTIWFDHSDMVNTNATFSLEPEGGTLYISDIDGQLIVKQTYPETLSRTSYARRTDGGNEWGLTPQPTPGHTNTTSAFTDTQVARPTVDKDGQFFLGTLNVSVAMPAGATLRYTTDGSVPTLANGQTSQTGLFSFDETTVLRLRLFQDGMIPSDVVTRTYICDENKYGVPVMSIVTNPEYLYSDTMGVYVRGTRGRRGRGQSSPANWNMDWDRPANFEFMEDGHDVVNREVQYAICGGWSRGWQPKSFKVKGDKVFGTYVSDDEQAYHINTLNHPFFKHKPYIRNRTLQTRNAGNDIESWKPGRMTDAAIQRIALTSGIDIDGQSAQPVVVYYNGQYNSVNYEGNNGGAQQGGNMNMREPNNKHYVYANYGLSSDEIDMWEMSVDSCYVQMCGDKEAFNRLYTLSENAADPAVYEQIKQLLDIDEYVNYNALQLYLGCSDWPHNNIKAFRSRQNGKFRHIVHDIDWCFKRQTSAFTDFENTRIHTFYPLFDVFDENGNPVQNITTEDEYVTIFLNLLANEEFRKHFIDMYCIMGGSVYEPNRSDSIIDDFAEEKRVALSFDGLDPASTAEELKNNVRNRLGYAIQAISSYGRMQLGGVTPQSVVLRSNCPAGRIMINQLEVPQNYFNGKLFAPVKLSAKAPAAYRFAGWKAEGTGSSESKTLFETGSRWKFYDQGGLASSTGWYGETYADSRWSEGTAPLGYNTGNKDLGTVIDYGSDANNKHVTYYFRKDIQLAETPESGSTFALNYRVDDGFVVYVNGQEAGRYNLPSGTITPSTLATTYADVELTGTLELPAGLFHKGANTIAVEVHNQRANSSDIRWDASLTATFPAGSSDKEEEETYYSTEAEIDLPEANSIQLTACFERLDDEELQAQHITPLRINEVSAANAIYVNDYYKKGDWVEIYNTTDKDIDLEGAYLSDNAKKPYKYQITKGESNASTIVPAGGFKIIWCDKRDPVSQLHATFKLDDAGGVVMLTAADKSWTDTFQYPAHNGDATVARYPNGSDSIYVTNVPTIEKSNIMTSYVKHVAPTPDTPDGIGETFINSSGSLRVYMADGAIAIRSEEAPTARVDVFTASGQEVLSTQVAFENERAEVGTSALPDGTYIVRVTDSQQNRCSMKFTTR